jgi:hypothetical protein
VDRFDVVRAERRRGGRTDGDGVRARELVAGGEGPGHRAGAGEHHQVGGVRREGGELGVRQRLDGGPRQAIHQDAGRGQDLFQLRPRIAGAREQDALAGGATMVEHRPGETGRRAGFGVQQLVAKPEPFTGRGSGLTDHGDPRARWPAWGTQTEVQVLDAVAAGARDPVGGSE